MKGEGEEKCHQMSHGGGGGPGGEWGQKFGKRVTFYLNGLVVNFKTWWS